MKVVLVLMLLILGCNASEPAAKRAEPEGMVWVVTQPDPRCKVLIDETGKQFVRCEGEQ